MFLCSCNITLQHNILLFTFLKLYLQPNWDLCQSIFLYTTSSFNDLPANLTKKRHVQMKNNYNEEYLLCYFEVF